MLRILRLRRHRFDALVAALAGAARTPHLFQDPRLRRDVGLHDPADGVRPYRIPSEALVFRAMR